MDEAESVRPWRARPPSVAAVLVAHNGAAWLPKVLASLADMEFAPSVWHAVDVSSTDGSAEMLRSVFGADRVSYAPSGTGFGDAVRLALEDLPRTDWIWLLHDDVAVTPSTLAGLLDEATAADEVAVAGPKIREWPSLRRLLEVGLSITGTGSRETGLETGEPDAGQHDRPHDVLAVNTAGMLVRRDVWDELGGLDPELRLFADDLDFGWRANLAGHRVRVAPAAVVFHAEASHRGIRRPTAGDVPHWERRRAAMHVLLVNASSRRFVWQYLRLFFGSLVRVVGFLIGQDPESASDELLALRSVYGHPRRLREARRQRAPLRRRSPRDLAGLMPPWWLPYQKDFDALRDAALTVIRPEVVVETAGRRSTLGDDSPDDALEFDDRPSWWRRRPWFAVVLLLTLAALIAGRGLSLVGLNGGALLPAPPTAGGWWSLVLSGGHDVGLPTDAFGPTFALLLAAAATPVWFTPGVVIWVILILGVPLAALTAHRLGRMISDHRRTRIVWAVSYGLLVGGTGAVSQGRIGTVVALIVAPIVVNLGLQILDDTRRRTSLKLGIWIAVATAFAPVSFWLSLAGLALLVAAHRAAGRSVAIAVGVAVVLVGPWMVQRVVRPWQMWWEAGTPLPGTHELRDVVFGNGGGAGSMPWWLTVSVIVLAVLALLPQTTRGDVQWAWGIALIGLVGLLVGHVVSFGTPSGAEGIAPWLGVPAGIWIGGLLTAALLVAPELEFMPRSVTVFVAIASLVFPLTAATWWVARGVDEPLSDGRSSIVPAYLAEREGATLVLVGGVADGIDYRIEVGSGPTLGDEAVLRSSPTSRELGDAIERLLSAPSADDVQVLADAGIDALYLPDADVEVAARIDAAPSLAPAGADRPGSRVWTVEFDVADGDAAAAIWRVAVGVLHIVVWIVAVVLTAPVRRRAEPPSYVDEVEVA